ncbi:vegetative cell wall protein gp1-like [Acropora millepora]|uniref:vegetative cell wall protein gp1-like n=1 Tax=Acropora millepora TaxID=45264 RepID=UPI001CF2343E|nr:vegetative cell wall protein gp1-like [Acropora millepora]
MAREGGQAGGQPRPSPSAPVPVLVDPVPDDPVPDPHLVPAPVTGSEDDGDLSSVSSDHPDPPAPDPLPVPSYPSLPVDDIPRRPRTKHTKRLSTQPAAFPFSSPQVPVIPKSKNVSSRVFL